MRLYLDASVLLRRVLGEPKSLPDGQPTDQRVTSSLAEVECLRGLDRLYLRGVLDEDEVATARSVIYAALDRMDIVPVDPLILHRASEPFPTPLGTLDAIHLSTALILLEADSVPLTFATHDRDLGRAARACGLSVVGL